MDTQIKHDSLVSILDGQELRVLVGGDPYVTSVLAKMEQIATGRRCSWRACRRTLDFILGKGDGFVNELRPNGAFNNDAFEKATVSKRILG